MSADETSLRVLLVGLGPTSTSALEGLSSDCDVVSLVRDGDDATTARAEELGVPVLADATVRGVRAAVAALRPDAVVVSSFNRILDAALVESCTFVNVHYARLPRGRGRATVNWAIINGDPEVTISVHRLVPGLDSGGILYQASVPVDPTSTVQTLYAALNSLQRQHISAAVRGAVAGDPGLEQDESRATYLCSRNPEDGEIDWSSSTQAIHRLLRSLGDPYPSAFTWLGLDRLHVDMAEPAPGAPVFEGRIPGRVVHVDRATGTVDVLTGDGLLRLFKVRVEDGDQVEAADAVTSVRATLGLQTADLVRELRRRH